MTNGGLFKSPDLDAPIYSLSDLARVTHLPVGTVRMWLERKILALGNHDIDASGKGSTRQFTARTLYLAATMAEITRLGVSPSQAARWAHVIWRTPFLEAGVVPRDKAVFIGNPNSDDWRIAHRDALRANVIFDSTGSDDRPQSSPAVSAILIDVAAVAHRCVAQLAEQSIPAGISDDSAQT